MLKECIEVFEKELERYGDRLVLDSYIPADGTYFLVNDDGTAEGPVEIKLDKKTRTLDKSHPLFPDVCYYDYHSKLISMNKPVDGKKIIHSNSYLSFAVKKESIASGKLTEEIIDEYYNSLKDPQGQKYKKSKEASRIYQLFEETEGPVNQDELEQKKQWIKQHIFHMEQVDLTKKDYLKIFFKTSREAYEREEKRYFLPNIYNSNDYNIEIDREIYGLPDNNVGMNAKKPFLSVKTRKFAAPYLLNGEEVIVQKKFFDYLLNYAAAGKWNVYIDIDKGRISAYSNEDEPKDVESGYYLRIQKGKNEAEIVNQDNLSGYHIRLRSAFFFQNIIKARHEKHKEYHEKYREYHNRVQVGGLINEVFFSKFLNSNYHTKAGEMSIVDEALKQNILLSRNVIFDWVYKGIDNGMEKMVDKISLNMVKDTLSKGYGDRALWQLNLRWSFQEYYKGEMNMANEISELKETLRQKVFSKTRIPLEKDTEYYYAVGQLAAFLISLNRFQNRQMSLVNPFMNAREDRIIKQRLLQLFKKYNYDIPDNSKRVRNLIAMVEEYTPDGPVNQDILLFGYADDNLIYMKGEN